MKEIKFRILTVLICCLRLNTLACWAAPPEFVILEANANDRFIRKVNPQLTIEVRKSSNFELDWKVKINKYDSLFSIIKLSQDGNTVVHILGNHSVNSLDDVCVEMFQRGGRKISYKVNDIMNSQLQKDVSKMSTAPEHIWLDKINFVTDARLGLKTINDKNSVLFMNEHKVLKPRK